jgi:ElaB/YqjD/DUF883 family membrane-anchored ribosome-binding protein
MSEDLDLETIVASFRDTNRRLADLSAASERLIQAEGAFAKAERHAGELIRTSVVENKEQLAHVIATSEQHLDQSQRALRETSSGLVKLIDQLRDATREIADVTDAFRKTEPERVLAETLRNRFFIRLALLASAAAAALSAISLAV